MSHLERALRYYERPIAPPVELGPPTVEQEIAGLSEEARAYVQSLEKEARTDLLTDLPNRRALGEWVKPVVESLLRQRQGQEQRADAPASFELIVIDIDKFKAVNDSRGHAIGDEVLKWLAQTLRAETRDDDLVARLGGEEFVVALAGAGAEQAQQRAESLRQAVAEQSRERLSGWGIDDREALTISLGVAEFDQACESYDDVFLRADAALYVAKQGRNAARIYNPNDPDMQAKLRTG